MRLRAPSLCVALIGVAAAVAQAETPKTPSAPPTASASAASSQAPASAIHSASALAGTTATVAAAIAKSAGSVSIVAASPLRADEPAPRSAELVARVVTLVASALGGGATPRTTPASREVAMSAARGNVVFLEIEIAHGELRVTSFVYRVATNVWDRIRASEPSLVAHAFASAPVDAEVRSFLSPVPLVLTHIDRAVIDDRDIVALACGSFDEDGSTRLVVVGRRRIAVGRVERGRFVPSHLRTWSELSPVAPAPLREPFSAAALFRSTDGRSLVDIASTDRARGVRLDSSLGLVDSIVGIPVSLGATDACVTPGQGRLLAPLSPCSSKDDRTAAIPLPAAFDALSIARIVDPRGAERVVTASRDPDAGTLELRSGSDALSIPGAGVAVTIADLDADGDPEVISSLDVLAPSDDALVVRTWHIGGRSNERAHIGVPLGVRAIAACPPDGAGAAPVAVVTQGELWIVR